MKELEVTVRIRNNRLKERRLALQMNQREFAKALKISSNAYRELEALRRSPLRHDGGWAQIASVLANFHCCDPDELFPEAALAVKTPVLTKLIDASELQQSIAPDEHVEHKQLAEVTGKLLDGLPGKCGRVLRMRLGLNSDGREQTLTEVGDQLGVTQERVRQIEAKALRMLRHPKRSKHLRSFTGKEPPRPRLRDDYQNYEAPAYVDCISIHLAPSGVPPCFPCGVSAVARGQRFVASDQNEATKRAYVTCSGCKDVLAARTIDVSSVGEKAEVRK